jgi:hypothetical protein
MAMIALLVFFIGSYGIGRFILQKARIDFSGPLENSVFSIGIGLGCWCYLLFLLGHLGLLYPWLFAALALISALPALAWIVKNALRTRLRVPKITLRVVDFIALASALFILTITCICCFSPVVGGITNDEIATHLSAPQKWLTLHAIAQLPDPSSAIAGHIELLFLWAMAFAPESGPKLLTWISLVLCLVLVYGFSQRIVGKRPALYACIFIVINPLIFRESCTAFIDIPAAFFTLAALGALWRMNESNNKKYLVLAAFFAGVGCGAKPTAYFYLPAFFAVASVILFKLHVRGRRFIKSIAALALLVCLFAAPWPLRNFILSGSPTFPPPLFLYTLHGNKPFVFSGQPLTKKDAAAQYDYYRSRIQIHGTGIKNFFLLPWTLTMHPESLSIGDSVGAVMLSFLPLVFFFRKRPLWLNGALLYSLIATASIYFLIIPEARYFIVVFMLLSPGFAWLLHAMENVPLALSLANIVVVCNGVFSGTVAIRIFHGQTAAALCSEYRESYRKSNIPFYEAFKFCNAEKPRDLVVFHENQVFYYLKTAYRCDENILAHGSQHANAYIMDIDYSQTLGRDFSKQTNTYAVESPAPNLKLVFKGPDARIYKIVN